MNRLACRYCIAERGLKGSEIKNLPQNDEEFFDHLEHEHHIPVAREGETDEQATQRFKEQNPDAGTTRCRCPSCQRKQKFGAQLAQAVEAIVDGVQKEMGL